MTGILVSISLSTIVVLILTSDLPCFSSTEPAAPPHPQPKPAEESEGDQRANVLLGYSPQTRAERPRATRRKSIT